MNSETIVLPSHLATEAVAPPYDATIVTCLRDGRHLIYQTRIQEGDDPVRIAQSHCIVRGHYNADAVRFVIITAGGDVTSMEAR